MGAVWTITRKDLRLRLRDRSILLYGIVAPFVLAAVLGATFSGLEDRVTLDLGIVTSSDAGLATTFVDEVLPPLQDDGLVSSVVPFDDVEGARAAVEAGELTAAVVFADAGEAALGDVEVLGNVDSPTGTAVTEAIVTAFAGRVADVATVVGAAAAAGVTDPGPLVEAARGAAEAVALTEQPVGLVPVDLVTYMAGGMAVFFLLFAVGIAVTGLLEEQRDGTLARLATAPIPAWAPLAAKGLTALLVGLFSMGALAVATTVAVGADWGDPIGVALLILAAVLAATGLVGLVASFTRTPESASAALGVVGTVLGALGGALFPLRDAGLLQALSIATPHHWFLQGLSRLAGGAGVGDVLDSVAVLLLLALVTTAVATVRLRTIQAA